VKWPSWQIEMLEFCLPLLLAWGNSSYFAWDILLLVDLNVTSGLGIKVSTPFLSEVGVRVLSKHATHIRTFYIYIYEKGQSGLSSLL